MLAQETATPEPIFKTPTPRPTDFYDCPEPGQMEGFGEETPSVSWMMNCGLCLSTQQATVWPTSIPTLEGTPGTPAATPTIEGGGGFVPGIQDWDLFGPWGDGYVDGVTVDTGYTVVASVGIFIVELDICHQGAGYRIAKCEVRSDGTTWYGYTDIGGNGCGIYGFILERTGEGTGSIAPAQMVCSLMGSFNLSESYLILNLIGARGVDTREGPDPPEPTDIPNDSFCSDISNGGETESGDPLNAEDVFTIPVPMLGKANCIVLMPEFTLPITAINIIPGINIENDLNFPGATLCVRALTLGTLKILGMAIDLDFYAVLIGAMMILRKVLRS